jgi:hypothetical protein
MNQTNLHRLIIAGLTVFVLLFIHYVPAANTSGDATNILTLAIAIVSAVLTMVYHLQPIAPGEIPPTLPATPMSAFTELLQAVLTFIGGLNGVSTTVTSHNAQTSVTTGTVVIPSTGTTTTTTTTNAPATPAVVAPPVAPAAPPAIEIDEKVG